MFTAKVKSIKPTLLELKAYEMENRLCSVLGNLNKHVRSSSHRFVLRMSHVLGAICIRQNVLL